MVLDLPGSKTGRHGGVQARLPQLPLVLRGMDGRGQEWEPGAEAWGQPGGLDEAGGCEKQVGRIDKCCSWVIRRIKR